MTPEEFEFKKRKAAALLRLQTTQNAPDLGFEPPAPKPDTSGLPPPNLSLMESAKYVVGQDIDRLKALGLGIGETLSFGMDDPLAGLVNYLTGSAPSVR